MEYCKNCGTKLCDVYCSHCGQKAAAERITVRYVFHEFFHFFTHVEHGFLYTSWQLLIKPGKTVKEFIDGKRKIHQSLVSYFLIWTTIYILFLYWIEKFFGENVVINYQQYFGPDATTRFAMSHLSIVLIVVMPFQTLYLYLLVTRKQYYYFETLVATIYSLGTVILLQFVFALGAVLIHLLTGATADLRVSDAFKIIYLAWFIFDVIKLFPVNHKLLRAVVFIILAFGTFTLWRMYALPAVIDWLFLKG